MFKFLAPAAIATFMAMSPAQALPVASTVTMIDSGATSTGLTLVADRDRDGRHDMRRDRDDRRRWIPGRRYDSAPSGWNRYGNRRPGNWRSRGCIMAGPIWFCP